MAAPLASQATAVPREAQRLVLAPVAADGRGQQMGKAFERGVDVRWRDTDALGHVNHAVFLTYLEEGRDAFFTQALTTDPDYVVARIELDFRAEIQLADRRVTVRLEVENVGTTSLTTRETITLPSGEKAAEARVITVRWDTGKHKPAAFTDAERRQLAGYS